MDVILGFSVAQLSFQGYSEALTWLQMAMLTQVTSICYKWSSSEAIMRVYSQPHIDLC